MKTEITVAYQNDGVYDRAMLIIDGSEYCSMLYKEVKNEKRIYLYDYFNNELYFGVLGFKLLLKEVASGFNKVAIENDLDREYGKFIRSELSAREISTYYYSEFNNIFR